MICFVDWHDGGVALVWEVEVKFCVGVLPFFFYFFFLFAVLLVLLLVLLIVVVVVKIRFRDVGVKIACVFVVFDREEVGVEVAGGEGLFVFG